MRVLAIAVIATLLLTGASFLFAPEASAGCDPRIPGTCVRCVYGYPGQGCIITNPCDPRYCDPVWP